MSIDPTKENKENTNQPKKDGSSSPTVDSDDDGMSVNSTSETVHVLKANKSTGIKSSYYHFSSTPAAEAERYKPQLITNTGAPPSTSPVPILLSTAPADVSSLIAPPSASTVAMAAPQAIGGSKWNAAGTWEDKDISIWAHAHFKTLISTVEVPSVSGKVSGVDKISGDCTIIFSRGRKKHGYDIACTINFTAKPGDTTINGTVEFPEIADSVADEPWQVLIAIKDPTNNTKAQGEIVYDAFKAAVPKFRKVIDQWVEDLKKQD
jgi:hypothetical protein